MCNVQNNLKIQVQNVECMSMRLLNLSVTFVLGS